MSDISRTTSHRTVLWIFHSSPILTKWITLEMWLVYLEYLPLLAIHKDDLIYIIVRGAFYGTTYGSLFKNSLFIILKCTIAITEVNDIIYSHFSTRFCNWTWNMCKIINWSTLIKHNIFSCTSASIWTVLPSGMMVLTIHYSLYQEVRYRCIL